VANLPACNTTSPVPLPRQVPALLGLVGPAHLLYGSDFCFTPAVGIEMEIASINGAPAPVKGATWQSLTTANAPGCCPASPLVDRLIEHVIRRFPRMGVRPHSDQLVTSGSSLYWISPSVFSVTLP